MTQPGDNALTIDGDEVFPGSPRWYLGRLAQRLLGRQARYDKLERYAMGNHDYPNVDKRYVEALRELQRKARTNYCELVISAVTQRMTVEGFQFGPEQQVDEDAEKVWDYNDMDFQAPMIIKMAAIFGDTYMLVSPPIEEGGEPVITAEDPRMCIVEEDPQYPTRLRAGLKMWQDEAEAFIWAVLYLPDQIRLYQGPAMTDHIGTDTADLTHKMISRSAAAGGFQLVAVQPNPMGEVPLVRGNWQPAFGTMGRAEIESVIDIQDRINYTVLSRLVITRSQAYNQRWVSGATPGQTFNPGADQVWSTTRVEARFGQFEAANLDGILASVRDDVGEMAAVSQTPATYLMNRMVNVSGDTLTQDQSALITKVGLRQQAMGWMFKRAMIMAFKAKGGLEAKVKEPKSITLWKPAQIYNLAELADSFSKFTAGGVPLDIAMKQTGLFTDDQIESAKVQYEEMMAQQQAMALEQTEADGEQKMNVAKQQGENAVKAAKAKPKPKPSSGS